MGLLLVVVMAASPLFISSQHMACRQNDIEKDEEVSVEHSSGVVRVWPFLSGGIWDLCVVDKGT